MPSAVRPAEGEDDMSNVRITDPRSTKRQDEIDDVLECIGEAWSKAPHLRLGQLLTNAADHGARDLFTLEDWPLVEAVEAEANDYEG